MTDQAPSVEQLQQQVVELRQEIAECRAALQERDLRYRALLYNLPEKVVHKDRDSVYLSCNKNFASDFGMTPEQMVGKTDYDLYPREMADKYRADDRRIMDSGGTEEIEELYSTPTKKESVVRTLKAAVKDEHGNVTGVLGIFSDVTTRKQAELSLQKSEERYRLLAESIPQAVWRADANGETSELNSHWYEYTGQTYEEARGFGWMKALHPDDVEGVFERMRAAGASGELYQAEYRLRRASDGSYRWHLAWGRPMKDKDGNILYWFGSVTDIDDQKQVEEALRESEERYRTLTDSTTDMIYIANRAGDILYVNRSGATAMEVDASSIAGKRQDELFPPEMARRHTESIARVFQTGEVGDEDAVYHLGPNVLWLNTRLVPLRDKNGQITSVMGVSRDITDRKRVEEALKKAHDELERRVAERTADLVKANEQLAIFQRFAEASEQGFGIADLNGYITYVNPTLCRLMGEEDPEDVIGQPFFNHVPETSRQFMRAEYTSTVLREGRWVREGELLTRQGTLIPVFVSDFLLRNEQGKPAYLATVITDITERKQAEEALHQSRDELQTIYDEMVDGCLITDIETKRLVRANSSMCRMVRYSEEELLARSLPDIHPPEEVTNDLRRFQAVAEGHRFINENRPILRKDGSIFYADITGRRILYHGQPCVLGLFRDVTERRQAQEALRESEEKYRTLVETSPDAVVMADLTGRATFVSRRFLELHGAERVDEFLGKTAFDYMVPEDYEKGYRYFQKTLEDGITRDVDYSFVRKDGTRYSAELSAALVKDASGKPVAIISVLKDITERKRAEAALRQSRDELQAIYDQIMDGIVIADSTRCKPCE